MVTPENPPVPNTEDTSGRWLSSTYRTDLVSVIVPTFNRSEMLLELLDNLIDQSWKHVEVVVIDDGSSDGTTEAVQNWISKNNRPEFSVILLQQENAGPGSARNRGIAACSGEYIFCIDSDDLILPDALEVMVSELKRSGRPYCLSTCLIADRDGNADPANRDGEPIQISGAPMKSSWMTHSALYSRSAMERAGPYRERVRIGEDTDFHWRIAITNGPGHVIKRVTGLRREHDRGHLSLHRTSRQEAASSIATRSALFDWAIEHGQLTRHIAQDIAETFLIVGIKLGYYGAVEDKRLAFTTLANLGDMGPKWAPLASKLGKPDNRLYFVPFRAALWLARQGRLLRTIASRRFR